MEARIKSPLCLASSCAIWWMVVYIQSPHSIHIEFFWRHITNKRVARMRQPRQTSAEISAAFLRTGRGMLILDAKYWHYVLFVGNGDLIGNLLVDIWVPWRVFRFDVARRVESQGNTAAPFGPLWSRRGPSVAGVDPWNALLLRPRCSSDCYP